MRRAQIVTLIVVAAALTLVAASPIQFHNLLSTQHPDTMPYSPPVAGDMIAGNGSGLWARVPPNTSTTPMVLGMTGNGTSGVSPQWVPTVGPRVVASLIRQNQAGGEFTQILYTATHDATFRVTGYMSAASIASSQVISFNLSWADDNSSKTFGQWISVTNGSNVYQQSTPQGLTFHMVSGASLVLSPNTNLPNDTADPYYLYITVEEL
jgi:hypothetical protein